MAIYLVDYENVRCDDLIGISRLGEEDRVILFYSEKADKISIGLHRRILECKAAIEYRKADVGAKDALDFQLVTYLGYLIAANESERFCVISNDLGFEYAANFWRKQKYDVRLMPAIMPFEKAPQSQTEETVSPAEETAPSAPETASVPESAQSPEETEPDEEPELPQVVPDEVPDLLPDPVEPDEETAPKNTPAPGARPRRSREGRRSSRSHSAKARKPEGSKAPAQTEEQPAEEETPAADTAFITKAVAAVLGEEEAGIVAEYILRYKSKLGINNALVKKYGNQRGGEIYQKIKSLIANKKGN